jgi:hypothetical protein
MGDSRSEAKLLFAHRFRLCSTDMGQPYEMAYRREKSMLGVIFDWRT